MNETETNKMKVKEFIDEIVEVCKKHQLSISHEDFQGGFIIEPFKERNIRWFRDAEPSIEVDSP